MKVRITLVLDVDKVDERRPDDVQLRDLESYVLQRLGVGPGSIAPPVIHDVYVASAQCLTVDTPSSRKTTPLEGVVSNYVNDTTKKVDV